MALPANKGMARKSRMPNVNRRDSVKRDNTFYIPIGSAVAADSLPAGPAEDRAMFAPLCRGQERPSEE